ncbi:MAG: hypothetical protein HY328_02590 [Chloroflexi bacterium]|nr:hypothetical protein [Chloroflexota bacterium]
MAGEQLWEKLDLLTVWQQQMVLGLIDLLLEAQSAVGRRNKSRLLSLSVWTEEDIQQIEQAQEKVNEWPLPQF